MHTTHIFKNGNSQAVRIPANMAYENMDITLEIERNGDEIRIRPARQTLSNVLEKFAQFSDDFMTEAADQANKTEFNTILAKVSSDRPSLAEDLD